MMDRTVHRVTQCKASQIAGSGFGSMMDWKAASFWVTFLRFAPFAGGAMANGSAAWWLIQPRQRWSGMTESGWIRTFCTRTGFRADLVRDSVRRGFAPTAE